MTTPAFLQTVGTICSRFLPPVPGLPPLPALEGTRRGGAQGRKAAKQRITLSPLMLA